MRHRPTTHLEGELFLRSIHGRYVWEASECQKSQLVWGLRCLQQDELDAGMVPEGEESRQDAPIYSCKFGQGNTYGHVVVVTNEDGEIGLWDTRSTSSVAAAGIPGHKIHESAVYDSCWVPGTAQLVSGGGDHRVVVVGVQEDGSLATLHTLSGHYMSVKAVHVNPFDPSVIASGGRDGNIIVWDQRCKPHHQADKISPAHHTHVVRGVNSPGLRRGSAAAPINNSVASLVFQLQHTLISAGSSDGLIKVWDLRKTHGGGRRDPQCQSVLEYSGQSSHQGFTSLALAPSRHHLYVSCMDNTIYAHHLANPTPSPVAEYRGHVTQTYFIKSCISPCGSYLLSGSSDKAAYLWLTSRPGPPLARLTGHFAQVIAVDWCPEDNGKVVTCDDDMKLRVFHLKNMNMDDIDERLSVRGEAERFVSEVNNGETDRVKQSEAQEPLPPLPVTPSMSRVRTSASATPSDAVRRETQATPCTPTSRTPRHRQGSRGRRTPCTPGSSDRNTNTTLLQWLTANKTPGRKDSPSPSAASGHSEGRRNNLKRKLTDLMGEDRENLPQEGDHTRSPTSPVKHVLSESSVVNTSPPLGAAKMLRYGDDPEPCKPVHGDDPDCVEPIEPQNSAVVARALRNSSAMAFSKCSEEDGGCTDPHVTCTNMTHPGRLSHLSSPTANLPNYVVDGSSPHTRPEVPRLQHRPTTDWLTSFSHQRRLRFSTTPNKHLRSFSQHTTSRRKILHIKQK